MDLDLVVVSALLFLLSLDHALTLDRLHKRVKYLERFGRHRD